MKPGEGLVQVLTKEEKLEVGKPCPCTPGQQKGK
jgi:hypothetical protein